MIMSKVTPKTDVKTNTETAVQKQRRIAKKMSHDRLVTFAALSAFAGLLIGKIYLEPPEPPQGEDWF